MPGSIVPLLLMMAIFFMRFAVGVTGARAPELAASIGFSLAVSLALGFCSGMFLARAWRVLRARPEAAV